MDGSGLSLILIPIVVSISLGAWLILVYYADAHPQRLGRHTGPDGSKTSWHHPATALAPLRPNPRALTGQVRRSTVGQAPDPDRPASGVVARTPASHRSPSHVRAQYQPMEIGRRS
jgi:hypothetical protein